MMSNLFAALTPMPTTPIRSGVLMPETSQADGEELAAIFAGVLATMMPDQVSSEQLSEQLPEQELLALPEAPLQSQIALTKSTELAEAIDLTEAAAPTEAVENAQVVLAQVPSLDVRPTLKSPDEPIHQPNDPVAVVMSQLQNKVLSSQAREPAPVMSRAETEAVDETIVLSQMPKKSLTQAISATLVLNDTQQQPVLGQVGAPVKPADATVMPVAIQPINHSAQEIKEVANLQLGDVDMKTTEAAITDLNNKPVVATSVPTTKATATVVSVPVSIHNERAFSEAFGLQLVKLATHGITQATVRINPQELGPIDVRIVMHGQQSAQVDFHARQVQTADLLETMMPRLVSAMEAQGIRLDDARVSTMSTSDAQSFAQQFGRQGQEAQADSQARGQGRTTASAEARSDDLMIEKLQPKPDSQPGRIDYYA